jgi:hypothetical protein
MANVKLIFKGTPEYGESNLECYLNYKNEVFIDVYNDEDLCHEKRFITLDIPTAVRLVKTLKTEIAKAKGGSNG